MALVLQSKRSLGEFLAIQVQRQNSLGPGLLFPKPTLFPTQGKVGPGEEVGVGHERQWGAGAGPAHGGHPGPHHGAGKSRAAPLPALLMGPLKNEESCHTGRKPLRLRVGKTTGQLSRQGCEGAKRPQPRKELEVWPVRKAGNLLREKRKMQQSWRKQAFFQIQCRPSLGGSPVSCPRAPGPGWGVHVAWVREQTEAHLQRPDA